MPFAQWAALALFVSLSSSPAAPSQAPSSPTSTWPAFRGADRDGVYRGSIKASWDGLTPMWKKPVGGGRASFAIAGGRAFTIEQRKGDEVVAAYDVQTGKELWTNAWRERFNSKLMGLWGGGEGPRATPTWADGLVYALGGRGELRCLDAATGKIVWRTNILKDADADNLTWGMAGSPLVTGDLVIVQPGGTKGKSVVAYERRTGKPVWSALNDKTAYASPVQVTLLGVPQYALVTADRLVGLSVDKREVLWDFPWSTGHDASAAQPIVIGDNRVFYSSGYGTGAVVLEFSRDGEKFAVKQVWRNIRMKNRQSTSVVHNGFIYGLDEGILACLDAATGDLKWKGGRYGHGQLLLAGDHLIVTTEDGDLVLVAASPDRMREIAKVAAVAGETWNVPAIADGILLVRNTREMAAFDLRPDRPEVQGSGGPGVQGSRGPEVQGSRGPEVEDGPLDLRTPGPQDLRVPVAKPSRDFFVSWGYNGSWYSKSDMHFSQPSLGNDFTLAGVRARDSKPWTNIFGHGLFVPQYNMRIGFFFNEKWGLEVALDHEKWIVRQGQIVRMTGTLNGSSVNADITLTPDVIRYQLNNGANPVFFNLVRRFQLRGERGRTGHVAFLAKAGGGFTWPHTENTLFGEDNDKGFQPFIGWDVDAVAALRVHYFKRLYVEVEEKLVYARYSGVKIDQGTARHSLKATEFVLNFGMSFR